METEKDIDVRSLNIYEKMSYITKELGVLEKELNVKISKTSSYKAVSERTVLDAIKPLEAKYRVYSYPSSRRIVDSDILVKESKYDGEIIKSNTLFMRVETVYTFVNVDDPIDIVNTFVYGDGLDTGDKAPGKAMTYADKYALMKAYKISTGDDPDKDPSPENGYKKSTKATPNQIKLLESFYKGENLEKLLKTNKLKKLEDISMKKASEIIAKIKEIGEIK